MRALLLRGGNYIEKYKPLFIGLIPCPLKVNRLLLLCSGLHWARRKCWALCKPCGFETHSVPSFIFDEGKNKRVRIFRFSHFLCLVVLKFSFYSHCIQNWLWTSLSVHQLCQPWSTRAKSGNRVGIQREIIGFHLAFKLGTHWTLTEAR